MREFLKQHPVAVGLALVMHLLLLGFFVVKFDADRDLSGGQIVEPIRSQLIVTGQQQPKVSPKPLPKPKPDLAAEKERARLAEIEKTRQAEARELERKKLEDEIKRRDEEMAEKERLATLKKQQEVEARKLEEQKRQEEEQEQEEQRLKEEAERKLAAEKLEQEKLEQQKKDEAERLKKEQERLAKEEEARQQEQARKDAEAAERAAAAQAAREAELDAQLAEEEQLLIANRIAGLRGQYIFAIRQRIQSKWYPQDGLTAQQCRLEVIQAPNGTVLDVRSNVSARCTEQMRESVEQAVYRSDPLPEAPSREVFERNLVINFCTPDVPEEICQ